ncbi:haloacid dehalogenase-like hydrolase [Candidatus Thioglobus sp.]|uniref:haloacid dehalogenase-like hydrolase n=1 Tax=Candidatus Thioglobus sp. TaxID=2026721 RepID=UPI00262A6A95|nr:haloacid dehalogenase-like hydrolase [Candidatus Thioglobus sp.]MDG2395731.1 haloacid dehalogenase-like hydrolase [Candidatus Thioglobus sp.]
MKCVPLIVDLDHTLINTDLLYESSIGVLKQQPWLVFAYPFWFFQGKGYLKSQLVKRFEIDVTQLPYLQQTIDYIHERKNQGCEIILATASYKDYAFAVAKHIGLFDDVMASNADFNLSSHNKADKLIERFGKHGFDYMGDHMRDMPVWEASNLAILVNVTEKIIKSTAHLDTLLISKKD